MKTTKKKRPRRVDGHAKGTTINVTAELKPGKASVINPPSPSPKS